MSGGSATLRTFFAVALGDDARREAAALAERLRAEAGGDAVRWVRPEAYHVTLRFVGATPAARVPALAVAVREETAGFAPFTLRLGAPGGFPNARRPRILTIEVADEPPGALAALAAAVERGTVAAGFAPETRAFRGHVTLGRLRDPRRRPPRLPAEPCAPSPFPVTSLALMRSETGTDGSRYTPLEVFALGGPAAS